MAEIPMLKRPAFFDGQRLEAGDLSAASSFHRELRWLHNRSLHNWGIAFGYAVSGERKARAVEVQPGFALDCDGHELILTEGREVAIPAVGGANDGGPRTYYLTVSYADDADLPPETRGGACGASGAVRLPERPNLRWQEPDDFRFGHDVVLCAIEVENCQLAADVSAAERRDAVPAQQPYIAAGQTVAGQTQWRLWPDGNTVRGIATTVNTTGAGFRNTPSYQAHVIGERVVPNTDFVLDGYAQVSQPTPFGFELIVLLPQSRLGGFVLNDFEFVFNQAITRVESTDVQKGGLGWYVVWMGLEG